MALNYLSKGTGHSFSYPESKELFDVAAKIESMFITNKIVSETYGTLVNPPYNLRPQVAWKMIDSLSSIAKMKKTNENRVKSKTAEVEQFFRNRIQNRYKCNINLDGVDRRYLKLVKGIVRDNRNILTLPPQGDCILLAEIIDATSDCDNTFLASYDKHLIDEHISKELSREYNITTGRPSKITRMIRQ